MPVVKLDPRTVAKLPPIDGRRTEYLDDDPKARGFAIRVTPTGHRSYTLKYSKDGRNRRLTLKGSVETVSLADARAWARERLAEVGLGADPVADRRAERAKQRQDAEAPHFHDVCDQFVQDQSAEWRPSTRKGWTRYIESEIKPALGEMHPAAVSSDDVRGLIEQIKNGIPARDARGRPRQDDSGNVVWKRKPAPVSARRCFEVLRRLCVWAVWRKHLPFSPCERAKPFERKRSGRRKAAKAKPYDDAQIRAILEESKGTEMEHLVDLIARTAVRSHEARAARWQDFDLQRKLWRVPAEMHKTGDDTGAPHLVPLTRGALRVLRAIQEANLKKGYRDSTWVFPAPTTICDVCGQGGHMDKPNYAAATLKADAGITDRGLLHRFRDTLKTRMSEHGVSERVSEHILGHVVPGIMGTYDHAEMLPQRLEALQWSNGELDRILKAKPRKHAAKVITLASARA